MLNVRDTAGDERYRALMKMYYKELHGVLLVYDITSKDSFTKLQFWVDDLAINGNSKECIMIVGNKADMDATRQVTQYEGKAMATMLNVEWKECSAKSALGTADALETLVRRMMEKYRTDPEYRNKGLCRWLIENITDRWKNCCDIVYLFANDSVLDFYPKFGFVQMSEYEYKRSGIKPNNTKVQKLRMNDERNIRLVLRKFEQGNPFSAFYMAENQGLLSFYCMGLMKYNIYYSPKYDVVIIAKSEEGKAICYDIFGETNAELYEILGEISASMEDEILLGFTPLNTAAFICKKHFEEGTTLFVYGGDNCLLNTDKLMFPIISHA
jgi:GTPase SAR1 family protein